MNNVVQIVQDMVSGTRALDNEVRDADMLLIARKTAYFYDLSLEDLKKRSKKQPLAEIRQIAMYLIRKRTSRSFKEIATFFGIRDHASAIHASQIIESRRKIYKQLNTHIEFIEAHL